MALLLGAMRTILILRIGNHAVVCKWFVECVSFDAVVNALEILFVGGCYNKEFNQSRIPYPLVYVTNEPIRTP